jgi:tetratricopeptide (TPR) repeat protein
MTRRPVAEEKEIVEWTPRVRRINAPDVGEQGKLTFIRSLIAEKRFDEATLELEALLAANPRSYLGNLNMGRLLERKGVYDLAAEHFEAARAANPTRAEAPLMAGAAYLALKDLEHAVEAFEAALELDPKQATAHLGLARVHFANNEYDDAEIRLQQALTFDPQLKPAHTLQARIYNGRGDDEAAKEAIKEILSARPDQLRPTVALARIHLRQKNPGDALLLLEAATTQHESNAQLWTLLGRIQLSTQDYAGAEAALRKAVAIDPRQREVALHLVDALVPQGKLQEARIILDRMPKMARRRGRIHASYAKLHMAGHHYKQAADAYRAALMCRRDGEAAVADVEAEIPKQGDVDWKSVAERYQTTLRDVRRTTAKGGERSTRKRSQQAKRRQRVARARAA